MTTERQRRLAIRRRDQALDTLPVLLFSMPKGNAMHWECHENP